MFAYFFLPEFLTKKFSNLDLGWVKSMPGDFGESTVNVGLIINFRPVAPFFGIHTTPCHMLFILLFNCDPLKVLLLQKYTHL